MTGEQDVVVIGAPRSGTNMLRDLVTALPEFGSWPCDEINPIWRHGNRDHPSDAFTPEMATDDVKRFVRGRFESLRSKAHVGRVVEKTCANSLRVGFVVRVLPDSKYVWITRDGLDAAMSAVERWHAPFDMRYTVDKARFVPPGDVIWYAARFVRSRLSRRAASATQSGGWWGPRVDGAEQLLATRPLDEVAVTQWRECVAASREGLAELPAEQVLHVPYESFVGEPDVWLGRLGEFLGTDTAPAASAVAKVSSTSVGKGRAALSEDDVARLSALAEPELSRFSHGS